MLRGLALLANSNGSYYNNQSVSLVCEQNDLTASDKSSLNGWQETKNPLEPRATTFVKVKVNLLSETKKTLSGSGRLLDDYQTDEAILKSLFKKNFNSES